MYMSNKNLNNQSFCKKFNERYLKRINMDIESINKIKGVNEIKFNKETSVIEIFYNEYVYKFELSEFYPFRAPKIYRNNNEINIISLINEYSASTTISILFNLQIDRDNSKYKILIFCHPYIIKAKKINNIKNTNHFLNKDIIILSKELGIKEADPLIIETIDLFAGANYKIDGFSDEFINANLERYDLVFIPDCGGLWYKLQEEYIIEKGKIINKFTEEEINNNLSLLIEYILKVLKLVKNNGIIAFSKILFDKKCKIGEYPFDNFLHAIQFFLFKNGFTSYVKKLDNSNQDIIVGKKI